MVLRKQPMSPPDDAESFASAARQVPRWRLLVVFALSVASMSLTIWILPGISADGWVAMVLATTTVAILNALLWPFVARYAAWLILLSLGIANLIANGLIIMLTAQIVPGFQVTSLGVAILASLVTTIISAIAGNLLSLDDDAVWRRNTMRRLVKRFGSPVETDVPGVLFLQIDGLAEPVLRRALSDGSLPTLKRWLSSGTHRIVGWECDLSSQTGASQAGILHGDNTDMPAFRWYDKEAGRVFTSNRPEDAAHIERQRSTGTGLLAEGGVSRSNVFSGDSQDSMFTFSTVTDRSRQGGHGFSFFLSDPYAISRLLVLSAAEIGREVTAYLRAKRRGVEPRMHRGGVYPLLRAATTVMLRDLTTYLLMSDIYRGVPAAYVDFVGYDEVAHHSGIFAPDALEVLYRLDKQIARLERATIEAPRPYHVVVLSDHGQTQGATFRQRYDMTLPEFVDSLIDQAVVVDDPLQVAEGWGNLNGLLSDTISDEENRIARAVRVAVAKRTVDGEVVLGPGHEQAGQTDEPHDVVVLASGNLGLISFPQLAGRATLEAVSDVFPGLVFGLANHPGIGFLLLRSEQLGSLVIGGQGIHYLSDGHVDGVDPLLPFGPRAADHLRRTDSFNNAPDILLNSFYDADADEGAAFEELIGFHGGLGGKQTEPFLLFPKTFDMPAEPIVGAAAVHQIFKGWLKDAATGRSSAPWERPAESDTPVQIPGQPSVAG